MLTIQIPDIKDFMSKLLLTELFDQFYVQEIEVTTFNTFSIDGKIHRDFFLDEELESNNLSFREYSFWQELKPVCLSLIKGKKSPLHFRFIFRFTEEMVSSFFQEEAFGLKENNVQGLYMNIKYNGSTLLCTSAVSLNLFTLDKSLEHALEQEIMKFFHNSHIPYEEV